MVLYHSSWTKNVYFGKKKSFGDDFNETDEINVINVRIIIVNSL